MQWPRIDSFSRPLDLQQNGQFLDHSSSFDLLREKGALCKAKEVCRKVQTGKRYINKKTQLQMQ